MITGIRRFASQSTDQRQDAHYNEIDGSGIIQNWDMILID
jgi:hypothetical protein